MGNKIFSSVVLLLWGSTMSWLVTAKILPHFFDGEPPVAELAKEAEPTAWQIALNGKPCGVAVTQAIPGALDTSEVHSVLSVESIPLPEVAPKWMQGLLSQLGEVSLEMRTRTTLDSFRNLAAFNTQIKVNDTLSMIGMSGEVQQDKLRLRLRTGEFMKTTEYPWRGSQMLAGELMPSARLTNLRVGKKWRTEMYNPFGPPNMPVNMIEAEVVSADEFSYQGKLIPMYHIEYRSAAAAGVSVADRVRSEVWVSDRGEVLRQKVSFLDATLSFDRLPQEEAIKLAENQLRLDLYATTTVPKEAADDSRPVDEPPGDDAGGK